LAFRDVAALNRSVGKKVVGSSWKSRFEGRLEFELVDARLGRPSAGRGIWRSDEHPAMRRAVADQRPLAALDGAIVDSKFFDTGCRRSELIAMFLRCSIGPAGFITKRGLLVGVSLHLLLSRRIRGHRLDLKQRASGRSESQRSHDEENNGFMERTSRYARGGVRRAEIHE